MSAWCNKCGVILTVDNAYQYEMISGKKQIKKTYLINSNKGILLKPSDWHEIKNVSKGAVITVLASEFYDKEDYITEKI